MHRTRLAFPTWSLLMTMSLTGCSSKSENTNAPAAGCSLVSSSCGCSSAGTCDAGSCNLGDESCATFATPDRVIDDLVRTGQAYVQLPVPYGQESCGNHGVLEVSGSSLATLTGLSVYSTWDQGQTTASCESRRSEFEVWVQRDNGLSDASPSSWTFHDRVTVRGVVLASLPRGCGAQAQCRMKDLPASFGTMCDAPSSYVALNRSADAGRITSVKVVAHASANCDALPLEFLTVPFTE